MERDRFFKADQAAEYGLIDRVIHTHYRPRTAIACSMRRPRPSISHAHGVAGLQVAGRVERLADAARRAGEDDRAGLERAGLGDEVDELVAGRRSGRAVLPSWRSSPLTWVVMRRPRGSGTSSAVVIHGPHGHDVSKPFARAHCFSRRCRSRAETSLATA